MKLAKHHGEPFKAIHVSLLLVVSSYCLGAFSYSRNLWPIELLRQIKASGEAFATPKPMLSLAQFDSFKRLTFYPGKQETKCPIQGKATGVLLVMGQSNAANFGQKQFTSHYPENVVNYHHGHCYVASSPLLGATGQAGEFITPLADQLISEGIYKDIVIIAAGVGGSPISRWARDGDLNEALITLLREVESKFHITDVIWHQGETDALDLINTTTKAYISAFHSVMDTLFSNNVRAPLFMSIATRWCQATDWAETNAVAIAQKALIDHERVFLGVDTDKLVGLEDRYDTCHFNETGQMKTAKALADAITAVKNHRS